MRPAPVQDRALPYFLFFFFLAGDVYFFIRSIRDGYLGKNSEEAKYRMLEDEES